jgi:hypothetical protein
MGKPSPKKLLRKRHKEKHAAEKQQPYQARRDRLASFPNLVFEPGDTPREFVDTVRETLLNLLADPHGLPKNVVDLLRTAKRVGFPRVRSLLHAGDPGGLQATLFELVVGEHLFARFPQAFLKQYLPYHDVELLGGLPRPNKIRVKFCSLQRHKTSGGTAYSSPLRPTATIGGETKQVAFYRHAIERLAERTVADPHSYGGAGDVFVFLHDAIYFEPFETDQANGFKLYQSCKRPIFSWQYVEQILGSFQPTAQYSHLVGYCPVVQEGGFFIAKTLLVPGMKGTPEAQLIRNAPIKWIERQRLLDSVDKLSFGELTKHRDFSTLKWFHDHGVPQVRKFNMPLFRLA